MTKKQSFRVSKENAEVAISAFGSRKSDQRARTPEEYLKLYPEILDIFKVFEMGRIKHGDTWLEEDGPTMSRKANSDSMFHHLTKYACGIELDESGLPHELHIACRAIMSYIRKKKGIIHTEDPKKKKASELGDGCITIEDHLEKMRKKPGTYFKKGDI